MLPTIWNQIRLLLGCLKIFILALVAILVSLSNHYAIVLESFMGNICAKSFEILDNGSGRDGF